MTSTYDPTKDPLAGSSTSATSGGRRTFLVTPNDDEDLPTCAKALRIETGGTICFIPVGNADDETETWTVVDGEVIDVVQVRRVLDTGTDATGITAVHD